MRTRLASLALILAACATHAPHDMECTPPTEFHAWMPRFVGEWEVTCTTLPEPESGPETWSFEESGRMIGNLWVVLEGVVVEGPEGFRSKMTLGYDTNKGAFVGTWVDSIQATQWVYTGRLSEDGERLVLEAEGPNIHDATRTARYRDQIEFHSDDHRSMTSGFVEEDGTWTTFMRMDARRK